MAVGQIRFRWAFSLAAAMAPAPAWCQSDTSADIVVVGGKIERTLTETSASVSLLSDADIRSAGFQSLTDALANTANVAPTFGASGFSIRGISNIGVTGAGDAPTSNIFIDGIPLAATYLQGAPTELWDVERVEVWRGPQSTIRGPNALAGAVILETKKPDLDAVDASARLMITDERSHRVSFAGGAPLIDGEIAARLSFDAKGRQGFIDNEVSGGGEDRETRERLGLNVRWQPRAAGRLLLDLAASRSHRIGGFYNVFARSDQPGYPERRTSLDNTPNQTEVDLTAISVRARYAASRTFTILSETTWSRANESSTFDTDSGPESDGYGQQRRSYGTISQEVRGEVRGARVTGVVGIYYYRRDIRSQTISRTAVPTPIPLLAGFLQQRGISLPQANELAFAYGRALPAITVDFDGSFPTRFESYAVFADAEVNVFDGVSVIGGLRVEREENVTGTTQASRFAGTLPNPTAFGTASPIVAGLNSAVLGLVAQSNAQVSPQSRFFTTALPKAGVKVRWGEALSTALTAQRGYRSGGQSTNVARGRLATYDPEYTWTYELSLRSVAPGGRLRVAANAFFTRWTDQQVAVNLGLNSFDVETVNARRSRLYGFEIEADWIPSNVWSVHASVGHVRTRFDNSTVDVGGSAVDLSGAEFAFAPQWTAALRTDVRLPSGWNANASARFASRSFGASRTDQSRYRVAPHAIANLRLGYDAPRWGVHLEVSNIFNEVYAMYKAPSDPRAILNDPRTIGLSVSARY